MRATLLSLLLFASAPVFAETPQDVARRIISTEPRSAYNPLNTTDAELNKAAAINSQIRLQTLMLGDAIPDELRICYALRLIRERLSLSRSTRHADAEQNLLRDQETLTVYLRQLNTPK